MEIQSAFNSGLQGFQRARESADQAAADIVASTTFNTDNDTSNNTEVNTEVTQQATTSNEVPELNQAIVELKVAEHQAKASAEVIKSADDTLGTLLDVTA